MPLALDSAFPTAVFLPFDKNVASQLMNRSNAFSHFAICDLFSFLSILHINETATKDCVRML